MKTLAVSIPTYKRPELLRQCLEALAKQCEHYDVNIYVYDDSCSDINKSVYADLCNCFPGIVVSYNQVNLGIDRNIDQCFTAPEAQYVWVMGEDDLVREGAIETVMQVLTVSHPKYLFVNYQFISDDYRTLFRVAGEEASDGPCKAGKFFGMFGWATGFIGANVVNKSLWDIDAPDYMGTYFNHVGKIFSRLSPLDSVEVVAKPLVYNRAESLESTSWGKDCFAVIAGFGKMIQALVRNHPEWTEEAQRGLLKFEEKRNTHSLKFVLMLRALGYYDLATYRCHLAGQQLWPFYALVAVMPVAILRPLHKYYRFMKAHQGNHNSQGQGSI
jgi:abequosyltransferase